MEAHLKEATLTTHPSSLLSLFKSLPMTLMEQLQLQLNNPMAEAKEVNHMVDNRLLEAVVMEE